MKDIEKFFLDINFLSKFINNYKIRPSQIELAKFYNDAIEFNHSIICEAGTGSGKTLAYLIPVIKSKKKAIISTGTKNLQDQIFWKDIPSAINSLKSPIKIAILKGRSNYICHHFLDKYSKFDDILGKEAEDELTKVLSFFRKTNTGDINECNDVAEKSKIWSEITSTKDNCLGSKCSFFDKCFVIKARQKAINSDLVVVNHSLLFADLILKEEGIGELLPDFEIVIFDEAHQIPDILKVALGFSFTNLKIIETTKHIVLELRKLGLDKKDLLDLLDLIVKNLHELRLLFSKKQIKYSFNELKKNINFFSLLKQIKTNIFKIDKFLKSEQIILNSHFDFKKEVSLLSSKISLWLDDSNENYIKWMLVTNKSLRFHLSPLDTSYFFKENILNDNNCLIFTSATLSIENDFTFFKKQIGLDQIKSKVFETPYNLEKQSLLYLPKNLPNPIMNNYEELFVKNIMPILKSSKGGAFLLFTSLNSMTKTFDIISKKFSDEKISFPLYLQGSDSKNILLKNFLNSKNSILLGSYSFWEGIDVVGDNLRLVIIDKIPFSSPSEPITEAIINKLKNQGNNSFADFQLPQAILSLKQGIGRLIRNESDKGVLMIADGRIISKSYGKVIIKSLPKMKKTSELSEIKDFFNKFKI